MAGGKPFGTDWGFWIVGILTFIIFLQNSINVENMNDINERIAEIQLHAGQHVNIQELLNLIKIMNEYSDLTRENRNLLINILNLNINDLPTPETFREFCQLLSYSKGHGNVGSSLGDFFSNLPPKPPGPGTGPSVSFTS
jgi:hypothetical protein